MRKPFGSALPTIRVKMIRIFKVKMPSRPVWRIAAAFAVLSIIWSALGVAGYAAVEVASGNFHTVIAGEIYRSGQLDDGQTEQYVKQFHIRTIINLRGRNTGRSWYDTEVATSERLKIMHVDFQMASGKMLSEQQAAELLAVFRGAEKPILIHCDAGADRTSLASALYVAGVAGRGEFAAEAQMSIWFGHLDVPFRRAHALDDSWEALEPWLGFTDS